MQIDLWLLVLVLCGTLHALKTFDNDSGLTKGKQRVSVINPDHHKAKIIGSTRKRPARNARTDPDYLWPNGKVPYVLDTNLPAFSIIEVLAAMQEIEMSTYSGGKSCIMYVPRTTETDYVHIAWTSGLAGSTSIGRMGGRQDMTITTAGRTGHDDNLYILMVTLGLIPEVMRQDRDQYIDINITNAVSTDKFRLLSGVGTSSFGQSFDYNSLMLEDPYVGSLDPSYPVTSAIQSGQVMGQSVSLSDGDATLLQHAYGCTIDSSNVINLLGDMPLNCHFHNDLCTLYQDPDANMDWVVHAGPTVTYGTGPNADHSSGSGKYALAEARGHHELVAVMKSPKIAAGQYCLRVNVHMYGNDVGQLKIIAEYASGSDEIATQTGSLPRSNWYNLYLTFESALDFSIHFIATIGEGDQGDIAIDDVYLYNGECIEW